MPRQANGTYILPAGNPVASNTLITPTWANPTMSDIGNALSDSLSRSGLGGMTAALLLEDGLVNVPGLGFTLEANTGFYRPASRVLGVAVNGIQVAQFNATSFIYGDAAAVGTRTILLNGAAGSVKALGYQTAGTARWFVGADGGNIYYIQALNSLGAETDVPLRIGPDSLDAIQLTRNLFTTRRVQADEGLVARGVITSYGGMSTFIDYLGSNTGRVAVYEWGAGTYGRLALQGGPAALGQGVVTVGTELNVGDGTDRLQVLGNVAAFGYTSDTTVVSHASGQMAIFDYTNNTARIGTYDWSASVWKPMVVGGGTTAGKVLIGTSALLPGGTPGATSLQVAGGIAAAAAMSGGQEGGAIIAADDAAVKFVQIGYSDSEDTGILKALHSGTSTKPLSLNPQGGANGPVRINTVAQVGDGAARLQVSGNVCADGYLQSLGNVAGLSLGRRDLNAGLWSLYVPAGAFQIDTPGQVNALSLNSEAGLSLYGQSAGLTLFRRDLAPGAWSLYSAVGMLQFYNGAADMMMLTTTGDLTIGGKLEFASAALPGTVVPFTNGAGAQAGALTNAPAAGNPTKWIPINDNGVTRHIPAW